MTTIVMPDALDVSDPLPERVRATWSAGDFGRIATTYAGTAAAFVARLGLSPGQRVLDVACGTGNLALPAARGGATVVGVDIAPPLLVQARAAARAEGLDVRFDEGDCEALPYADASFDVVMSMFGAMFAARPERTAAELLRVVRPGGAIALANWTPGGFVGEMFRVTAAHVPPSASVPSPLLWGDAAIVGVRLDGVAELRRTLRNAVFELPFEPAAVVEHFRAWYGPTLDAFAALDSAGRESLRRALTMLWAEHNRATDGTTRVEAEFLEVVAVR
jgi:SAM-dependent methyltransferase